MHCLDEAERPSNGISGVQWFMIEVRGVDTFDSIKIAPQI